MEGQQPSLQKEAETAVSGEEVMAKLLQIKTIVSYFEKYLPTLVEYFTKLCQTYEAGQVGACLAAWKELTHDGRLLSYVFGTRIELIEEPRQNRLPAQLFSDKEHITVEREILKLLQKGVIVKASHKPEQILCNIFLRPKKDGTHRLLLNLKKFNQSVSYHHFKMDSLYTIMKLITKYCYENIVY